MGAPTTRKVPPTASDSPNSPAAVPLLGEPSPVLVRRIDGNWAVAVEVAVTEGYLRPETMVTEEAVDEVLDEEELEVEVECEVVDVGWELVVVVEVVEVVGVEVVEVGVVVVIEEAVLAVVLCVVVALNVVLNVPELVEGAKTPATSAMTAATAMSTMTATTITTLPIAGLSLDLECSMTRAAPESIYTESPE